jgi:hypothetical protein
MPLLLLLPLLGLLGVFGPGSGEHGFAEGGWQVTSEVPTRLRFGQLGRIRLELHNDTPLERTIRLRVDPAFVRRFAEVSAHPELDHTLNTPPLTVAADGRATFMLEMRAHRAGRFTGFLEITGDDLARRIEFTTVVFP